MKELFFTAGPSQLYPTVQRHVVDGVKNNIYSLSHRGARFQELYANMVLGLQRLLKIPADYHIFFLSSGTEAMERIIQNCVEKKSFHFVNGSFSRRFQTIADQLKKDTTVYEAEMGQGFDFDRAEIPAETELICFTHNETSTGVMLPLEKIYEIKKTHQEKLVALDIVSSAPYVDVDFTKLDCVFFSVQKGMGLPAGLGVLIVSPAAFQKAISLEKKGISTGTYHSFSEMEKYAVKNQTAETPNVLDMYLLGKVIQDMNRAGIDNIRAETDQKAKLLYDFLEKIEGYNIFVKNETDRSKTVIVAGVLGGSKNLIETLKKQRVHVSSGYQSMKETHIRISNFPTHRIEDVRKLIQLLQSYS